MKEYFDAIENKIKNILDRPYNSVFTFDILNQNNIETTLREKQLQMRIGEIWQVILGSYKSFLNLNTGHASGLDIISYEKKNHN